MSRQFLRKASRDSARPMVLCPGDSWFYALALAGLGLAFGGPAVATEPPKLAAAAEADVTFCRDVAPILWGHCAECHRNGEVAPFALTSYQDAAKRATFLAEVVVARRMPPWKPAPNFGQFVGERHMSDREIEVLALWAKRGAPEGNRADLPALPKFANGWQLDTPDLVLRMPEPFEVPADGPNIFRWFAIPVDLPEARVLRAVEFRPGNRRVVHHLATFLDLSPTGQRLDAADPGPGYASFGGPGVVPLGTLGTWGPGVTPFPLPEGTGIVLPGRCTVLLQAHYTPSGRVERDQSEIGLYFADRRDLRFVTMIPVVDTQFVLEPGNARQRVSMSFTLPVDVTVIGVTPHMHYLGREMTAVARRPDGQTVPLIRIADWDFNWQDQYRLREGLRLPSGTRLEVEAFFDNSAENPFNPHSPPRAVRYGQLSTDEMCILGVQLAVDRSLDYVPLARSLFEAYAKYRDGKLVIDPLQ